MMPTWALILGFASEPPPAHTSTDQFCGDGYAKGKETRTGALARGNCRARAEDYENHAGNGAKASLEVEG
jgi:hypothetical protein